MTDGIELELTSWKKFVVLGIALLLIGFFFFYWSSNVTWEHVTTYNDNVNLASGFVYNTYDFGFVHEYTFYRVLTMQPDDRVVVTCNASALNETLYTVIWMNQPSLQVLDFSPKSVAYLFGGSGNLIYINYYDNDIGVYFRLASKNVQNATVSVTTELHHYERPNWILFGFGVVTTSLGVVAIYESRRDLK